MIYSFSRLKCYEQCPAAFYKKYVLGLPEQPSEAMILGKATHKAIEHYLNGDDIKSTVYKAITDKLTPIKYEDVLKLAGHPEVENMRSNQLKKVEQHFQLPLDDQNSPVIQGYIDLWWEGFLEITLVDWKTHHKKYQPKDNHQLGLYAWALSQITGKNLIRGCLVFLRYGQTNCYEIAEYDQNDMEGARLWALTLANMIEAGLNKILTLKHLSHHSVFPANPGTHCEHCSYANICRDEAEVGRIILPDNLVNKEDAEATGREIIRLEKVLELLKCKLKNWVNNNGPVQIDDQEFKLCPSISWHFPPDKLRELCQALGEDGFNPWEILSIGSTKLKKLNLPDKKLAEYGKKKETTSFRKVKIETA